MRLPVIGNISTKDGATNKNARLTNMLAEQKKSGTTLATVRPGLSAYATVAGNGNGLVCFNGSLVSVFGANIGVPGGDVFEYTSNTYAFSDAVLNGKKFGSNYVLVPEESAIYTTSDFSSYVDHDGGYEVWPSGVAVSETLAIVPYGRADDETYWVKVFDTSLTDTDYQTAYQVMGPTYGNGYFASTGGGKFCRSSNGQTWTQGDSLPAGLVSSKFIAFNDSKFCFFYTKSDGYLYCTTSTDGLTYSGTSFVLDTAIYGASSIVSAGEWLIIVGNNTVARSDDNGQTWDLSSSFPYDFAPRASINLAEGSGIAYNSTTKQIMAVGSSTYYGDPHTLMLSTDNGETWVSDTGTNICYAGVVNTASGFACFKCGSEPAGSRAQVLTDVGFGITNIAAIEDSPLDFALIP